MDKKNQKRQRRVPGASAKKKPQKAPHAQPRKHAPVQEEPVRTAPEIVYLPPKPFSRSRLILRLATVVAVVVALMLGLSIFFKVGNVVVSGCDQYTAWQVQQASGISDGDQLLTFSRARAAGKIISQLPYVRDVRIGITLPDTVRIEIVETRVTYAVEASDGSWWLMDSDGKLVEHVAEGEQTAHTLILGVAIENPSLGMQAAAYQASVTATDEDGNVIPVTVTAAQRLSTAVQIAGYLELNGIIGQISSIDVTNLFEIELWYAQQYQALLGDTENLNRKVSCLKAFLDDYNEKRPYESGTVDISDPEWIEYQSFTE